jgi:hypothetical protein
MKIEHISYKHGMIKKPSQRKKLHARYLHKGNIPDEIVALIEENGVMSIKGTLGEKEGGYPIEYEEVKIKAEGNETRFEVYNKGMSIFVNETAELKRVFKLCIKLQDALRF